MSGINSGIVFQYGIIPLKIRHKNIGFFFLVNLYLFHTLKRIIEEYTVIYIFKKILEILQSTAWPQRDSVKIP